VAGVRRVGRRVGRAVVRSDVSYTLIELESETRADGGSGARSTESVAPSRRAPVLAVGVFDGVHIGHRSLLEAGSREALEHGAPLWVLTFWPHPEVVLGRTKGEHFLLTTLPEKVSLLRQAGASRVLALAFDRDVAAASPEEFVDRVLAERIQPHTVTVGYNFSFGRSGAGTPSLLRELCRRRGIRVIVHPAVRLGGEVVSSTAVRNALGAGDVERAGLFLGRPYSLAGRIEPGAGRGRRLGFPTANVALSPELVHPAPGVYVCSVGVGSEAALDPSPGRTLPAVANLGSAPTFVSATGSALKLEVHCLTGKAPDYGEQARVYFHARLRPEKKFAGPAELAAQISADRSQAEAFFGLTRPSRPTGRG